MPITKTIEYKKIASLIFTIFREQLANVAFLVIIGADALWIS